jgi:hypothetical protein
MLMRTPRREVPEVRSEPDAEHRDKMLDEALRETFPASDPIAITIDKPLKSIASEEQGRTIWQTRRLRRSAGQNPSRRS